MLMLSDESLLSELTIGVSGLSVPVFVNKRVTGAFLLMPLGGLVRTVSVVGVVDGVFDGRLDPELRGRGCAGG